MHFGFALFKYFPFGGLQRDMLAIARACMARGHRVTVFCGGWEGEKPADIDVVTVPVSGVSNHARDAAFAQALPGAIKSRTLDKVVGFNKMPGLDFYYAADSCFAAKIHEERGFLYRFLPRARSYQRMEAGVFAATATTRVLLISEPEMAVFKQYYGTPETRMRLLPPGIRRDRVMPSDYAERRAAFRAAQGWGDAERIILFVGSGFRTKGLDRALRALASQLQAGQTTRMLILGKDKAEKFEALARNLGIASQVTFLGGVNNVSEYLWAADVLLHPAYRENTGTVLLEAMVAGLPVVTTNACGYAAYVTRERMGEVVPNPVVQADLDEALRRVLSENGDTWRARGLTFAHSADIYDMPARAAELLENWQ